MNVAHCYIVCLASLKEFSVSIDSAGEPFDSCVNPTSTILSGKSIICKVR
jgi:hypothetical protein